MKVRNHVSLGLELTCVKRYPSCRLGPDTGGMVDIVRSEALLYQLVCSQSLSQLMDDGSHDFQMRKLLRTNVGQGSLALFIWHGVALGKITHGSAHFAVRPTILAHYKLSHLSIGLFDINRKFQSLLINPH